MRKIAQTFNLISFIVTALIVATTIADPITSPTDMVVRVFFAFLLTTQALSWFALR
jgi:hypothetical protein